jgi:outer membrane murein-binding lipoprotein Lpp
MTTKEIRKKIAESKELEWFNSVDVTLNYPHIDFNINLKGFSSIHKFLEEQINGWEKIEEKIPIELSYSLTHFKKQINSLDNFLNSNIDLSKAHLSHPWNVLKNQLQIDKKFFTYNCPETKFLLQTYTEQPKLFIAAFAYLTENLSQNINVKDNFNGYLLAYEFKHNDYSKIIERRNKEKSSISKIRNDFKNQFSETEIQLVEHLAESNQKVDDFSVQVDELKAEKETLFNDWFALSKENFTTFDSDSKAKIEDLQNTYEELLRLKKPAEYWNKRAEKLKKEGWKAINWLVGLVVFACLTLYALLWLTPEGMLLSFITGSASAIKWSVIYITFISFLAYGIKAIHKVAFSSFHLARDAEEREQLTYVYLALIKDSAVDEKDKNLIMQSLFSRADTGLLKEDSSPTMPNNIVGKIFGN